MSSGFYLVKHFIEPILWRQILLALFGNNGRGLKSPRGGHLTIWSNRGVRSKNFCSDSIPKHRRDFETQLPEPSRLTT